MSQKMDKKDAQGKKKWRKEREKKTAEKSKRKSRYNIYFLLSPIINLVSPKKDMYIES